MGSVGSVSFDSGSTCFEGSLCFPPFISTLNKVSESPSGTGVMSDTVRIGEIIPSISELSLLSYMKVKS